MLWVTGPGGAVNLDDDPVEDSVHPVLLGDDDGDQHGDELGDGTGDRHDNESCAGKM